MHDAHARGAGRDGAAGGTTEESPSSLASVPFAPILYATSTPGDGNEACEVGMPRDGVWAG